MVGEVMLFSTAGLPSDERLEIWGDQIWSAVGGLKTTLPDDLPFEAEVNMAEVGPIKLCRLKVGPHRIDRTSALIRHNDLGLVKVTLQVKGRLRIEQDGCTASLQPGQWTIYDTSRPYAACNEEPVEVLALLIPRAAFLGRRDMLRGGPRVFPWSHGVARIAYDYIGSLFEQASNLDRDVGSGVAQVAMDLVQMALHENLRETHALTVRQMLRARLQAYVARTLKDPGLSIGMIADAHDCTKRYVHMIFAEGEETLSQYILHRRLDRCSEDLRRTDRLQRSITEVAFSWGFNSSTHFSRAFRERFGVSPSEYRSMSRAVGEPQNTDPADKARWAAAERFPEGMRVASLLEKPLSPSPLS
jgi:AraC-like DNA-binding protein